MRDRRASGSEQLYALDELLAPRAFLIHDLVDTLARDIEVLGKARLMAAFQYVPGHQVTDGNAEFLDAFAISAHGPPNTSDGVRIR